MQLKNSQSSLLVLRGEIGPKYYSEIVKTLRNVCCGFFDSIMTVCIVCMCIDVHCECCNGSIETSVRR